MFTKKLLELMELSTIVFNLGVSLVILNSTLFSSCFGVLLFTGINVDDGLILVFGALSLSSRHKLDLLKPEMMLYVSLQKLLCKAPSKELGMLALTLFVALANCKTFTKLDTKLFLLDHKPQHSVAVRP